MRVRELMTPRPHCIAPDETLEGAMELMLRKHIRHLPVVNAQGVLVGLVTDRDLRRVAPSPLAAPAHPEQVMEAVTVERAMVRQPMTIDVDAEIREAVQILVDKKYGALPVLEGGKLVGIITPIDVMRLFLTRL